MIELLSSGNQSVQEIAMMLGQLRQTRGKKKVG